MIEFKYPCSGKFSGKPMMELLQSDEGKKSSCWITGIGTNSYRGKNHEVRSVAKSIILKALGT